MYELDKLTELTITALEEIKRYGSAENALEIWNSAPNRKGKDIMCNAFKKYIKLHSE